METPTPMHVSIKSTLNEERKKNHTLEKQKGRNNIKKETKQNTKT
jgi:hypothetical protein